MVAELSSHELHMLASGLWVDDTISDFLGVCVFWGRSGMKLEDDREDGVGDRNARTV